MFGQEAGRNRHRQGNGLERHYDMTRIAKNVPTTAPPTPTTPKTDRELLPQRKMNRERGRLF